MEQKILICLTGARGAHGAIARRLVEVVNKTDLEAAKESAAMVLEFKREIVICMHVKANGAAGQSGLHATFLVVGASKQGIELAWAKTVQE